AVAAAKAIQEGARAVLCASTGNTAASAAAYAARAGLPCTVVLPAGYVAAGKLVQAIAFGARIVAVRGAFDEALAIVRELGESGAATPANSINAPHTVAPAIRIGDPASWQSAVRARDESGGAIEAVSDDEILSAYRDVACHDGVFCEPASAASIAGLRKRARSGAMAGVRRV